MNRRLLLVAVILATPLSAEDWIQVRSPDLYGRRVTVAGRTQPTTRLLAGADAARDGFWLRVPEGTGPQDLVFTPPLDRPAEVRTVKLPPGLAPTWHVVPFGLSAYAVDDLVQLRSFGVSGGGSGAYKAGSLRLRDETPAAACGPVAAPRETELPLRVADFEDGPLQPLGNRFGLYSGRGGEVTARRARDTGTTRLVLDAKLPEERSYAGLWIELAPQEALPTERDGVDLGDLRAVVVRGRGRAHGEVRLNDAGAAERDAGLVLGRLEGAAAGAWTRLFPVDAARVDLRKLRSLVIALEKGKLEIEEVLLLGAGQVPPPVHRAAVPPAAPAPRRAVWAWHTRELLDDPAARRDLLAVARRWKLDEVYLQLPHGDTLAQIADRPALAALVAELHAARLQVHALGGAPWLALPQARGELVGMAASVAAWNASHAPASRFDALHLDVEPYLLPPFGSRRRGELLADFRQSLVQVKAAIDALPLWVDVPFWFDSADDGTTVETGPSAGCAKPAFLRDVFAIADGVAVMSYRTRADAADGVAAVALGELALGRATGKPVRIGVETVRLGPERGWRVDLAGRPRPRAGQPAVAIATGTGHVLFTPAYADGDAEKLAGFTLIAAEYSETAPPAKITFHGRTRHELESVVDEALELARRAGTPAQGVALHEARTLP